MFVFLGLHIFDFISLFNKRVFKREGIL